MKLWTLEEMVYLTSHYSNTPMREMCAHLDRSVDSVHGKAKFMELHRENGGRINRATAKAMRKLQANPTPLRDKIISLFAEHQELTIQQMRKACNTRASSCWRVCDKLIQQGNIHLPRFQATGTAGALEAVYRIGAGKSVTRPDPHQRVAGPDPYAPVPIPRPTLGLWGLVWNTTTPPCAAERNATP